MKLLRKLWVEVLVGDQRNSLTKYRHLYWENHEKPTIQDNTSQYIGKCYKAHKRPLRAAPVLFIHIRGLDTSKPTNNKGTDQPVHVQSLISAFIIRSLECTKGIWKVLSMASQLHNALIKCYQIIHFWTLEFNGYLFDLC